MAKVKQKQGLSDGEEASDTESSVYSGLSSEEEESGDEAETEDTDDSENDIEHPSSSRSMSSKNISAQSEEDKVDEYEHDSSDEEDIRNTIGDIPVRWYDEYDHIGYDWDGKKIIKPAKSDEVDEFLKKMDDPNYWRTVKDKMTGQDVILSNEDLEIIQRIQQGKYPDASYNPYEPFEDLYSHEVMIHPVTNRQEHKRSFIPSLIEKKMVSKMVHAIKMGWMKPPQKRDDAPKFYLLWDNDEQAEVSKRMQHYIPAPKLPLPGHEESYNPPPEYLFTKEEEEKWRSMDPAERKINFIPKKYPSLRATPAYTDFIKERFERCLDLYLCPRQRKMKANVDPEDLIPKLPKPKDLQPFPSIHALVYTGHNDMVRSISVEPCGQFFVSGSDDHTVKIWEVKTGRCMKTLTFDDVVRCVAWCPSSSVCLIAVAVGKMVHIMNPGIGSKSVISNTDMIFAEPLLESEEKVEGKSELEWTIAQGSLHKQGVRVSVTHFKDVQQVTWHGKGDYFATVMPDAGNKAVVIHQLSKRRSQLPFRKSKGLVQRVLFHPLRPYFFVATQRYVRIYNLLKQELTKKLMANCKWISSMAIHPQGDNVIAGSYDCRLSWFDLDLSTKPYKTLRYHKKAVRQVTYHRVYPLFASASDDGSVIVSHGQVYSDLLKNPLIVPVKVLRSHQVTKDLGVLDCCFHPIHPWIFSAGADATIRLYTN